MKIVLISNLYEPYARGGAEVIVKRTAEELIRQGHKVTIITARPCCSNTPPFQGGDGGVLSFYPLNIFFYANDYKWPFLVRAVWHLFDIFNLHSAWTIKKMLRVESPDVVITHNLIGLGYLIPRVIRKLGLKHIHVLHDIQLVVRRGVLSKTRRSPEESKGEGGTCARTKDIDKYHPWHVKIYQAITRWLFASPQVVISPSQFLLSFYKKRGYFPQSKLVVLRNPVDNRFYRDTNTRIHANDTNFGYVGQLVEHKGLNVLKDAFQQISNDNVKLHIVGDGAMAQEIKKWSQQDQRVNYAGKIPNKELPKFLVKLDAVILPTLTYENSPTIIYESLAMGVPVIVSDIGGAAEMVENGVNGFVVEAGDVDDLVRVMRLIMERGDRMKEAARRSVEGLEVDKYVKRLLGVWTRISRIDG